MKIKDKLITIVVLMVILAVIAGTGAMDAHIAAPHGNIESAADLARRPLGGVAGRMPESSSKIFFESMLGRKLSAYRAYGSMDETLYALRAGDVAAIWACDVSARYLLKTEDDLKQIDISDTSDIQHTSEARFEFGMATANTSSGRELSEELDSALLILKQNGTLEQLTAYYIDEADQAELLSASASGSGAGRARKLRVGITGAVPPIELIDDRGIPYGFCVALMNELGRSIDRDIEFVVLDNETIFSQLMDGYIDVVFCYGAGRITTEGEKSHVMTSGYYPMQRYEFLTLK